MATRCVAFERVNALQRAVTRVAARCSALKRAESFFVKNINELI